jgi:hypothetical protein
MTDRQSPTADRRSENKDGRLLQLIDIQSAVIGRWRFLII